LTEGTRLPSWLTLGVLSCSNISTGTNPSFFPAQDAQLQQTVVNGIVMQPVNFHIEPLRIGNLFNSLLGGFGASAARRVVTQSGNTGLLPCVYTFSKDYDTSEPYLPPVNETKSVRLDSTFQPDPPEGWFGLGNASGIQPPLLGLNYFQTAPWFHVAIDPSASDSDIHNLGSRNKAASVPNPLNSLGAFLGTGSNSTASPGLTTTIESAISGIVSNAANESGWTGILGNMDSMLFFNITVNRTTFTNFVNQSDSVTTTVQQNLTFSNLSATGFNLTGLQPLPWFNTTAIVTDDDLDDLISDDILRTVHELTLINATSIRLGYWSSAIMRYPAVAASIQVASNMPWGILRFTTVQNGTFTYMIQTGTDVRLSNVASYPAEGLRRMAFQTMFSKAICMSLKYPNQCVRQLRILQFHRVILLCHGILVRKLRFQQVY
jgi:hypothetical protein